MCCCAVMNVATEHIGIRGSCGDEVGRSKDREVPVEEESSFYDHSSHEGYVDFFTSFYRLCKLFTKCQWQCDMLG